MSKIKIGLLQFDIAWENPENNKNKISEILDKSLKKNDIDLLVMPEMTLSGFTMNKVKAYLSETDFDFFKNICLKYSSAVIFGYVNDDKNKCRVLDNTGNILNDYSKIHLFSFADEQNHYSAGSDCHSFDVAGFTARTLICYDLRFSYLFWDNANSTDLFIVIANWPASRRNHWITLLKARAIENQSFVIGVNRMGKDPKLAYSGDSLVFAPDGTELLNCGDGEDLFKIELNKDLLSETRKKFPFLNDRKK